MGTTLAYKMTDPGSKLTWVCYIGFPCRRSRPHKCNHKYVVRTKKMSWFRYDWKSGEWTLNTNNLHLHRLKSTPEAKFNQLYFVCFAIVLSPMYSALQHTSQLSGVARYERRNILPALCLPPGRPGPELCSQRGVGPPSRVEDLRQPLHQLLAPGHRGSLCWEVLFFPRSWKGITDFTILCNHKNKGGKEIPSWAVRDQILTKTKY